LHYTNQISAIKTEYDQKLASLQQKKALDGEERQNSMTQSLLDSLYKRIDVQHAQAHEAQETILKLTEQNLKSNAMVELQKQQHLDEIKILKENFKSKEEEVQRLKSIVEKEEKEQLLKQQNLTDVGTQMEEQIVVEVID
jgi:hypothetical protein